ncbi:KAP P-loop domain-containing protein [Calothrix sp. NIES-4071]|nr:KAP P-loop domain-containing protein [Calothrix sp. NIES-4071]BAZ57633.1 KAP P-loop domain-containing protein [Calothrix sp. NIES-4105]
MTDTQDISTDSYLVDPENDLLGHASFAKYLADSICEMSFPEGFIIGIYGSWNSGKSTLLNFIAHYLNQKPDEEKPIIVPFNPWLFSGHQNITRRFFEQLQNVLSQEKAVPRGIRKAIADFAGVLSEIPLPYAQTGKAIVTLLDDKEKEASQFKEEVEKTLAKQNRRIVITVDDIDRLPGEDVKQLFRIFKAIPNFSNVVYVLVFDKEAVMKTIGETEETSQEAYLKKIIQAEFELPIPTKNLLRKLLSKKLNNIFADIPKEQFNQSRWSNIYFQGIDDFINNIPDISRLTNALTVTYPAVKGEVNPVDFIALECLRIFCPAIYEIIYQNPRAFAGEVNTSTDELRNLVNTWIAQLPSEDKQPVQNLLMQLFPKVKYVWSNSSPTEEESEWQKQLRICSLEIFPIYFRLTLSAYELSNTQIKAMLALANDAERFKEHLIELVKRKHTEGAAQASIFLEQLESSTVQCIPVNAIPSVVEALYDASEELVLSQENESNDIFDLGNEAIISRYISQLLHRIEESERFEVLKKAISSGKGLAIINQQIATVKEQLSQDSSDENLNEESLIGAQHLEELEQINPPNPSP